MLCCLESKPIITNLRVTNLLTCFLQETLTLKVQEDSVYPTDLTIDTVDLWGLERKITNVKADEILVNPANIIYDGFTKVRPLKLFNSVSNL